MNIQSDWSLLGDLAFRKFPLYQMKWDSEIDLLRCFIVGCRFGGPIAVFPLSDTDSLWCSNIDLNSSITNHQRHYHESIDQIMPTLVIPHKPRFIVYSSSGERISVGQSRGTNVILADWTNNQMLLLLQSDGTILVYDTSGILQRELQIDMSIIGTNSLIVDAHIVTPHHLSTSIVFLCKKFSKSTSKDSQPKFYYCPNIPLSDSDMHLSMMQLRSSVDLPTITCTKLTDITIPANTSFCWTAMVRQSTAMQTTNSIIVLVAYGQNLYILQDSQASSVLSVIPVNTRCTVQTAVTPTAPPVVHIAASSESNRIAILASSGRIMVISVSLDDQNKFVDTKLRDFDARTASIQAPDYIVWCGLNALCAVWKNNIVLVGLQRENQTYSVDCAKYIVEEIDCIRIVGSKSHEMLAQVAPVNNEIFRVATMSSGAILLEAYKDFKKRNLRSYEAIQIIRERKELNSAVQKCIQAAGHEYDVEYQKLLLDAAHFGKTFVPSIAIVEYPSMCRSLRVLNVLRAKGIPMTYSQLEYLSIDKLIEQLLNLQRFELAIWVSTWLKVPVHKGMSRVLSSWAFSKLRKTNLSDDQIANEINKSLGANPVISYAEIASKAIEYNRVYLALKLIENEAQSTKQIPVLLSLKEFDLVFPRAVESCDSNLIHMCIFNLIDSTKDDVRFLGQIKKHPKAFRFYLNFLRHTDVQKLKLTLHSTCMFEDEAKLYVMQSHKSETKTTKNYYIEQLESALSVCKLGEKNEFVIRQMELRIKLVKFQFSLSGLSAPLKPPTHRRLLRSSKLVDDDAGASKTALGNHWIDLSASDTIINLLLLKETGKASECEKLSGISEKKFETLRQIASNTLQPLPPPPV